MEFLISNRDDSFFSHVLDPANLIPRLERGEEIFKTLAHEQARTDHYAVNKYGYKIAGGSGDVKIIARMPEAVLIEILKIEPDFLKDKANFERVLKKYPIYRAYSYTGTRGGAF